MKIIETGFDGLLAMEPDIYNDSRGYFFESYNLQKFKEFGLNVNFVQDNQSFSSKHVLRGLHFQLKPHQQGKLVRAITGKVLDVVVDIRKNSPTFGKKFKYILDSKKNNFLYIPEGFAHGFLTLEDSIFFYKCTRLYHKDSDSGILWNDPDLGIDWEVKHPIVSEKDQRLQTFQEFLNNIE